MDKWYIVKPDESLLVGPFSAKNRAMMYYGWVDSTKDGSLYMHRRSWLGKKSVFLRNGFGYVFRDYAVQIPKPLERPGSRGW